MLFPTLKKQNFLPKDNMGCGPRKKNNNNSDNGQ